MTIETMAMAIRINRLGREKPLKKQAIPMHMAKSARKTKKPAFCRSDQLDKLCLSLEECKKVFIIHVTFL